VPDAEANRDANTARYHVGLPFRTFIVQERRIQRINIEVYYCTRKLTDSQQKLETFQKNSL
jgi:hypothetical protein